MKILKVFAIVCFPLAAFAQLSFFEKPPKTEYYIRYYHFVEGKQLVEIDYRSAWVHKETYREAHHPMGTTHRMHMGPHKANVLIFRDSTGKVLEIFNHPSKALSEFNILPVGHRKIEERKHRNEFPYVIGWPYRFKPKYYMYYEIDSTAMKEVKYSAYPYDNSELANYKQGLIDSTGQLIFQAKYDLAFPVGELVVVGLGKEYGLADLNGNLIHQIKYESIMPSYTLHGYFDIKKNGEYGLIDPGGKLVRRIKSDKPITSLE